MKRDLRIELKVRIPKFLQLTLFFLCSLMCHSSRKESCATFPSCTLCICPMWLAHVRLSLPQGLHGLCTHLSKVVMPSDSFYHSTRTAPSHTTCTASIPPSFCKTLPIIIYESTINPAFVILLIGNRLLAKIDTCKTL